MIPYHIINAIKETESSFIMGGGALNILYNGKFITNDYDIFCHVSEIEKISKLLDIKLDKKICKYNINDTTHIFEGFSKNIKIDLISYRNGFKIDEKVDFHNRMVLFDGEKIIFPTNQCYEDCINKKLSFNINYPFLNKSEMKEVIDYINYDNEIISPNKSQLKAIKNIKKYIHRGFILNDAL